jgi:hypothetical protein
MEYLMTYGWAILVVMIVGVAMWRMGIFSIGGSVAPTASGFSALKPLLPLCQYSTTTHGWAGFSGVQCVFVNAEASTIYLKDFTILLDGDGCEYMYVDLASPAYDLDRSMVSLYQCAAYPCNTGNNLFQWCSDSTCTHCTGPCGGGCSCADVAIPKDSTFSVGVMSMSVPGRCLDVKSGDTISLDVNLVYDISYGGAVEAKNSEGRIQMRL